ncbi:MAG: VWA domain-containing protein [Acidobacteria bacterium]|nr:VWA domain-containing protein [Acidobacteriota bacterium]
MTSPKRSTFRISAVAFALATALLFGFDSVPLAAQEPEVSLEAEFGGSVEVTEVLLDVLVNDRQGNVIIGLDKGDFVVEENGEPVEIESLTFYSNRLLESPSPGLASAGVTPQDVPQDRYFLLFFQDQRRNALELPRLLSRQLDAGRQAKRWIRSELQPGDWVAVVSYDVKLKVHEDFTQDRRELMAAVDRAMKGEDTGNWPSRVKEGGGPSLTQALPQGNLLRDHTKTIYDALQVLARASGEVQGRKNLLLFTIGFGDVDSFGQYRPDARYYRPTMESLNDNNVAVYPIDLMPSGFDHTFESAMNHLALDTGGRYFFNFTSFMTPLREAAESTSGYYLLSYTARHPADESGYQEVKVSTKNPEFKVQAREGYLYGDGR